MCEACRRVLRQQVEREAPGIPQPPYSVSRGEVESRIDPSDLLLPLENNQSQGGYLTAHLSTAAALALPALTQESAPGTSVTRGVNADHFPIRHVQLHNGDRRLPIWPLRDAAWLTVKAMLRQGPWCAQSTAVARHPVIPLPRTAPPGCWAGTPSPGRPPLPRGLPASDTQACEVRVGMGLHGHRPGACSSRHAERQSSQRADRGSAVRPEPKERTRSPRYRTTPLRNRLPRRPAR